MKVQRAAGPLIVLWGAVLGGCGEPGTMGQDQAASPSTVDLHLGERVFTEVCRECHGDATRPAPAISDSESWETRLRQNPAALVDHAIRGHGAMPPKGGHAELTVPEVRAAVAYVIDRARRIIRSKRNLERLAACERLLDAASCPENLQGDLLTLRMLYLLNRSSEGK